jgi:hypothetical protein
MFQGNAALQKRITAVVSNRVATRFRMYSIVVPNIPLWQNSGPCEVPDLTVSAAKKIRIINLLACGH